MRYFKGGKRDKSGIIRRRKRIGRDGAENSFHPVKMKSRAISKIF